MKLYFTPTSPYARKVQICAKLQGISLEYVHAPPFDDDLEVLREAPVGRVPALVSPDGTFHDSRAICTYLGMAAADNADLSLVSLTDSLLDAALTLVLERRRKSPDEEWQRRQRSRIERVLDAAERQCPAPNATWTLGSIGLAVALAYLAFRHPDIGWRTHGHLRAFAEAHFEREEMRETAFPE